MTGRFLDLEGWSRRSHFELFRGYDNPFFNISTEVRVTTLLRRCRETPGWSFFLRTLHASAGAANDIEAFRMRLRPEGVWVHDRVHPGSTVLRRNDTFGFAYIDFDPDPEAFEERSREILERVRDEESSVDPKDHRDDLVHYSVLPWIRFTSFSHARRRSDLDSVPKVVFGRHFEDDDEHRMPVSVEVHHALVDGLHVARFLDRFQERLEALGGEGERPTDVGETLRAPQSHR